jgi:hypothetical protein
LIRRWLLPQRNSSGNSIAIALPAFNPRDIEIPHARELDLP